MITDITAGYLRDPYEINDRFPYMNSNGRVYSELGGHFTQVPGSDSVITGDVIVKGTFDKESYEHGMTNGFQVVVYPEGQDRKTQKPIYQAGDRTMAYQSVQSMELQSALQTVEGVGEIYSQRIVQTFWKNKEDVFYNIASYLDGNSDKQTSVPKRLLVAVCEEQDAIREKLEMLTTYAAEFLNVLNKQGFLIFKGYSTYSFQRTIKEWGLVHAYIHCLSDEAIDARLSQLSGHDELVKDYGKYFIYLLTEPDIILRIFGRPIDDTRPVKKEADNVELVHALIGLANELFAFDDVQKRQLEERGTLAYSADLYLYLKMYKDDGFDNPRSGDTVYAINAHRTHREIQRMHAGKYDKPFEVYADAFMNDSDGRQYAVTLFHWGDVLFGQFTQTYVMNQKIVTLIKERQGALQTEYAEKALYQTALDEVLEDNAFDLHADQYNAIVGLNAYPMSVMTGGPGTGKTTILSVFMRTLSKINSDLFKRDAHNIVFCAPTGRAAKRMKASLDAYRTEYPMLEIVQEQTYTIHSFLLKQGKVLDRAESADTGSKWLVIDESSMVDEKMLLKILEMVPQSYRIVFVGDEAQLPSIGPGTVLDDLLTLANIGTFNLTQPYRTTGTVMSNAYAIRGQKGDVRKRSLNELTFDASFSIMSYEDMIRYHKSELGQDNNYYEYVNSHVPEMYNLNMYSGWAASFLYKQYEDGLFDPDNAMVLMPFSKNVADKQERVAVTPFNQSIQELMHPFRDVLPESLVDLRYDELLSLFNDPSNNVLFNLNRDIMKTYGVFSGFGVNSGSVFRVGDSVTAVSNQYKVLRIDSSKMGPSSRPTYTIDELSGMWYARLQKANLLVDSNEPVMNGDMGTVKAVMTDGSVAVAFDNQEDDQWVYLQHKPEFRDSIALSYATTVHKSQGSETDTIVLFLSHDADMDVMDYRELLYTAITRAKKRVIMIGSHESLYTSMNVQKNNRHTALPYLFDNAGIGKGGKDE